MYVWVCEIEREREVCDISTIICRCTGWYLIAEIWANTVPHCWDSQHLEVQIGGCSLQGQPSPSPLLKPLPDEERQPLERFFKNPANFRPYLRDSAPIWCVAASSASETGSRHVWVNGLRDHCWPTSGSLELGQFWESSFIRRRFRKHFCILSTHIIDFLQIMPSQSVLDDKQNIISQIVRPNVVLSGYGEEY